jgi:hypothetical protein
MLFFRELLNQFKKSALIQLWICVELKIIIFKTIEVRFNWINARIKSSNVGNKSVIEHKEINWINARIKMN